MGGAVSRHNALIASAGADSGGPVKTTEDGAYAVFSAVGQALRLLSRPICCIDAAVEAICGLRGGLRCMSDRPSGGVTIISARP